VAPAERPDEAAELLDDFLLALVVLPTWVALCQEVPDALRGRLSGWVKARQLERRLSSRIT
jgi:hypothetical protein